MAALDTEIGAERLLDLLQEMEAAHGRLRETHWGPRTLDLDLLVYGDRESDDPRLTLPHPGVGERAFVLVPLVEIAPDLDIPGLGPVAALCDALPERARRALTKLGS